MKFSASFELFEKAVSIVNANPAANMLNDICQYVLLETSADNQKILLTKSDLDVHMTSATPATVEQAGRTLVHGENLAKILRTYKQLKKSDDCSVLVTSDSNKITIAFSDNKKYKPAVFSVRDPEDFSPIEEFKNEIASCNIVSANLRDYFAKNLVAIGKHESTPEWNGVFFKFKGKDIELVSSNRQEVAVIRATPINVHYESGLNEAFSLIPRKTLDTAVKILYGNDPVEVSISCDMVRIAGKCDDVEFSILNDTYEIDAALDGAGMIPKNAKNVVSIPTAELKNALTHMEAIMEKKLANKVIIFSDPANPDIVTLSCKSATGEIPGLPITAKLERIKEPSTLALNDQRLLSLLKTIRSQNIRIAYDKSGGTCVFTGDDEPYFALVAGTLEEKTAEPPQKTTEPQKQEEDLFIEGYEDLTTVNDLNDIENALKEI